MRKVSSRHIGKLPPRYGFILNPYVDARFSKCPKCDKPMHDRKFALFIHVDGADPVVLGKTCKYCSKCELIVAHQDELEELLAKQFSVTKPRVVGNDYKIVGTVERTFWKAGMGKPPTAAETFEHMADIKTHLDIEYRPAGWYPADSE